MVDGSRIRFCLVSINNEQQLLVLLENGDELNNDEETVGLECTRAGTYTRK